MSHATWSARFLLKLLENARHGELEIKLPDGSVRTFGEGLPKIKMEVKKWELFKQFVNRGDLGLAEGIMDGDIIVDDAAALVQWACHNDQALGQTVHGTWLGTLISQVRHILAANTRRGAKKNIMAHYDLGNDFYRLWLDPSMTYSSGIFTDAQESLDIAQLAKYDRLIDQLNIKSSDHVLEIGCGWGGFFSRAVEKTGCKVTAVMNSPEQARHNRELLVRRKITSHVELQERDYRDIEGRYDKVVSIEMIEAVGEKHWKDYFGKVSASIKAGGEAMIQGITIRDDLFATYRKQTDFIQQYVFPGGMLLSNEMFSKQCGEHNLKLDHIYEFGLSYAKTLELWRENFRKCETQVRAMGFDDKFIRLWDFYLAYCQGAFQAGRINVGQFRVLA